MSTDWGKYSFALKKLVAGSTRAANQDGKGISKKTIGEDISPLPHLKIIFDGFGENDDGTDNFEIQNFCIFIHKNSKDLSFIFPEHDMAHGLIRHRPEEEVVLGLSFAKPNMMNFKPGGPKDAWAENWAVQEDFPDDAVLTREEIYNIVESAIEAASFPEQWF